MSAEAVARVQQLWEKLTVRRVARCVAREPEDVLSMTLCGLDPADPTRSTLHYSGNLDQVIESKRSADVPSKDRWRLRTHWRYFYGFTTDKVHFAKSTQSLFDYGLGLGGELRYDDHYHDRRGVFNPRPREGELIAGEVVQGQKGPRFDRWFRCRREFLMLIGLIKQGQPVPIEELIRLLHTPSGGYGDTYWVFANLVLNDDVTPFVHALMRDSERPPHAAAGMEGFRGYTITNQRINLGDDPTSWLFQVSLMLGQNQWLADFEEQSGVGWKRLYEMTEDNHPAYL